jgi:hypothetical protein
LTKLFFQGYAG